MSTLGAYHKKLDDITHQSCPQKLATCFKNSSLQINLMLTQAHSVRLNEMVFKGSPMDRLVEALDGYEPTVKATSHCQVAHDRCQRKSCRLIANLADS